MPKIITDVLLKRIRENDQTLKILNFDGASVSPDDKVGIEDLVKLVEALQENTSVIELNLGNNHQLGDQGANILANALAGGISLKVLKLHGNSISAKGIKFLSTALEVNVTLIYLYLQGNNIGSDGAKYLADALLKNTALSFIQLQGTNIGPNGARHLGPVLEDNRTLVSIHLGGNGIGPEGMSYLSKALARNSSLAWLQLHGNGIGNAGVAMLITALAKNSYLTWLSLNRNDVDADGARIFAKMLGTNKSLATVNFQNSIGDEGADFLLQALQENFSLTLIGLSRDKIDAKKVSAIDELIKRNQALFEQLVSGIRKGNVGLVNKLLQQGVIINQIAGNWSSIKGYTPVMEACREGSVAILEALIPYLHNIGLRCDKDSADQYKTALDFATTRGDKDILRLIESIERQLIIEQLETKPREIDIDQEEKKEFDDDFPSQPFFEEDILELQEIHLSQLISAVQSQQLTELHLGKIYTTETQARQTLLGHSKYIYPVVYLGNGILASGGQDGIRIWNVFSNECIGVLPGHTSTTAALTVLSNGQLVSGGTDGMIKFWSLAERKCLKTLPAHSESSSVYRGVYALIVIGVHLVSASHDNTIKIWHMPSGTCLYTLTEHLDHVNALTVISDRKFASGSYDGTIKIWDILNGKCEQTLVGHSSYINALTTISQDVISKAFPLHPSTQLVSGSRDNTIKIWDISRGMCVKTLTGHSSHIYDLIMLPNGQLASGSEDKTIKLWDIPMGECVFTLTGHSKPVWSLAVIGNRQLASGSHDMTIKVWNLSRACNEKEYTEILQSLHHNTSVKTLIFPKMALSEALIDELARLIVNNKSITRLDLRNVRLNIASLKILLPVIKHNACLQDVQLSSLSQIYAILEKQPPRMLMGHKNTAWRFVALSKDIIISGSYDSTIKIWDLKTSSCLQTLAGHSDIVCALLLLPNGQLVSASADKTIRIWDLKTYSCIKILHGHSDIIDVLALLPDGRLVSGGHDQTIKIWELKTYLCVQTLTEHSGTVYALTVLPNGKLISGSADNTIKIWDLYNSVCIATLTGHSGYVRDFVVLPNGNLVSGSHDTTIKIWDLKTCSCIKTLHGHSSTVANLILLPDDKLISRGDEHTIKRWDLKTGSCIQILSGGIQGLLMLPNGDFIFGSNHAIKLCSAVVLSCSIKQYSDLLIELSDIGSIKEINLSNIESNRELLTILCQIIDHNKGIISLNLEGMGLVDDDVKILLEAFNRNTVLKEMHLDRKGIQVGLLIQLDHYLQRNNSNQEVIAMDEAKVIQILQEETTRHREFLSQITELESKLKSSESIIQQHTLELQSIKEKMVESSKHDEVLGLLQKRYHELQSVLAREELTQRIYKEQQYICQNLKLNEYYLTLQIQLNDAFLACKVIHSGMVADERKSRAENITSFVTRIAEQTSIPGVGLVMGIIAKGVSFAEERNKKQAVQRVANLVVGASSIEHLAETVARRLTLSQAMKIQSIELSANSSLIQKLVQLKQKIVVDDIDNPVKELASSNSRAIIAAVMEGKISRSNPDPLEQQCCQVIIMTGDYQTLGLPVDQSMSPQGLLYLQQMMDKMQTDGKQREEELEHMRKKIETLEQRKNRCCVIL